ncbi:MAG: hypothetical protein NZU63_09425 [Gemmataceae bacterium]|nr:hypothetical protein [Gemmataceae bacterium]MDW8244459.1 hypothetical protein [Thermogemmata sp.]
MVQFTCDGCGKNLTPPGTSRYVVRLEAYAAQTLSDVLTEDDLQDDQVEEMARFLQQVEAGLVTPPSSVPERRQMRFDLCLDCYRRFLQDPLRREPVIRLRFHQN